MLKINGLISTSGSPARNRESVCVRERKRERERARQSKSEIDSEREKLVCFDSFALDMHIYSLSKKKTRTAVTALGQMIS